MSLQKKQIYRDTEILTADPGRLILLLYNGALSFLRHGKECLEKKDYKEKGRLLMKAHAIVSELLQSLNYEQGGDIAKRLKSIYIYLLKRILDADMKQDTSAIDEVAFLLSELREAWETIILKKPEKNLPLREQPEKTGITARV